MKQAEASIYLDKHRPKKDGKCAVKIKVTFNRKRKYYPTGLDLELEDFEKVIYAKRKTKEQKEYYTKITFFETKAKEAIKKIKVFTFGKFEEVYLEDRNVTDSVETEFEKYIDELKSEDRISTAITYEYSIKSLEEFKKNLTFADITPAFLGRYERWMLKKNKSKTTVGIYLRNLRAIYNLQNIDKSNYPFGNDKKRYTIPNGKNIKKALTIEEVGKIYDYDAPKNSTKEMSRDYWLFLYLCNGMNVKDFCFLKWSNIDGNILTYQRAKTKRSNKKDNRISVSLKQETMDIIKKWGQPSISKDAYIFPHFKHGITAIQEVAIVKQLTKTINKYMKQIATELELNRSVTTYFARHSFATVLKRSGVNVSMISELLGHSSLTVTENYLDSFEKEQIHEQTNFLTAAFKTAN